MVTIKIIKENDISPRIALKLCHKLAERYDLGGMTIKPVASIYKVGAQRFAITATKEKKSNSLFIHIRYNGENKRD